MKTDNPESYHMDKKPHTGSEIEQLIINSFLRNVPQLLVEGCSMEEAIEKAYQRDLEMLINFQITCEKLQTGKERNFMSDDEQARVEIIETMGRSIWEKINNEQK